MTSSSKLVSVAVLAHNEAERIEGSLRALANAGLGPDDVVHVLVNGSTDATAEIVAGVAARDRRFHLHQLPYGDKSHTWNTYVYRIAAEDRRHVFLDGDVRPAARAIIELMSTLEQHPEALAASALPRGGRRSQSWAGKILAHHGLPGNLYALRETTVARLKAERFHLPVGFVGDDTMLRWILLRGLSPKATVDKHRIRPAPGAFFEYESFPLGSAAGLRALYKRQRRYSRRDLETALLIDRLSAQGYRGLPRYASELYHDAKLTSFRRAGLIPRQVFALATYLDARRAAGRIPASNPWATVFDN